MGLPTSYKVPGKYTFYDLISGAAGFIPVGDKVVIIGQKTSAGTATALVPVQIYGAAEAKTLFGANSMAYLMARAFFKAYDKAEVWVLPLADEGAGTAATKTIAITAADVLAGTYTLRIGMEKISIAVEAEATDAEIATALAAAINLNTEQPFTAGADDDDVTLTCVNKGTSGNCVKVEATEQPSGVSSVIAAGVTGATDPDLAAVSGALEVLFPTDFSLIVNPYIDDGEGSNMTAMKEYVDDVSDGDEQRGCLHVFGYTDQVDDLAAFMELTSGHNHWRSIGFYYPGVRAIYYEVAAACAAIITTQPRRGDIIDDYIVPGLDVPEVASRLTEAQKNAILTNGGAPLKALSGQAAIVMARTTYVSNPGGGYVDKLTDMITPRSLDWLRIQVNNMELNQYANKKNSAQVRENLQDSVYAILKKAEGDDYEITQNVDTLRDGIIATADEENTGRCNVDVPADIVPGLHQIVNTIRLI